MRSARSWIIAFLFGPAALAFAASPWWEEETQMEPGGKLNLSDKPWWNRAVALQVGEQMVIRSDYPEGGGMIVRREKRQRAAGSMIVWIIDDDGDMRGDAPEGDQDSDSYVVDYGGDGMVDRLVDWIDQDGDRVPDEMEIRYFEQGELRRAWFGTDLDHDGKMWDLADYEYTGNFFRSDPYGNNEIYMNKYNPETNALMPISECPFAFFDTDGDGESEVVVRFSAAPAAFSPETDSDYANSARRYQGPYDPTMERMSVVNVRYSFDVDGLSSRENPLHYEMGFTMTGNLPYRFSGMKRTQPLRREPKTTVCIPYRQVREAADHYPAQQTGFTWREFEDSGIQLGPPGAPDSDRRWEGVFWTWSRRLLHNTGGPIQDWNVRREFLSSPSEQRNLYTSPVDHRIHLKGAQEGWMEIGRIVDEKALGEIHMFDTNADGYFDRWEYYGFPRAEPYRIASVINTKNRDYKNDWKRLQSDYTQQVLPEAIRANEQWIAALNDLGGNFIPSLPDNVTQALQAATCDEERRFLLDLQREFYYMHFRNRILSRSRRGLDQDKQNENRTVLSTQSPSARAWETSVQWAKIDSLYAEGNIQEAAERITRLRSIWLETFTAP